VVGYVCPTCGKLSELTPEGDPCEPGGHPWERVATSLHGFRFRCYDCLGPLLNTKGFGTDEHAALVRKLRKLEGLEKP